MSEVRRHQRRTASGKRTTVRHHTRDAATGGTNDQPPGTWYFRNREDGDIYAVHPDGSTHRLTGETEEATPPPNVSELRTAEPERPAEEWWAEDEPEPVRDYTLADETPNHARDV